MPTTDPRIYIRSITEEGVIEGYVCIFGDPDTTDAYGTYFDPNNLPPMDLKYLPKPLRYEHGYDPEIGKEPIGDVVKVWLDKVGIRFQGVLDKAHKFYQRFVDEIKRGELATSSGSSDYLADFYEDGRFKYWPLNELSLTASPAEERMPTVALVRSTDGLRVQVSNSSISIDTPPVSGGDPIDAAGQPVADRKHDGAESITQHPIRNTGGKTKMALTLEMLGVQPGASFEEVMKALVDLVGPEAAQAMVGKLMGGASAAADPNADAAPTPEMMSVEGRSKKPAPAKPAEPNAEIAAMRSELDALKKAQLDKMIESPVTQTPVIRTDAPRISLGEELKYAGKSHSDMEFAYLVMRSRGMTPSPEFMRSLSGKVADALEKGDKSLTTPTVRSAMRGAIRSNEIAISTASGGGDEWVAIDYASQAWAVTRNETTLIDTLIAKGMMVKEVPQGTESTQIPTEGADPTVYTIAQNGSLTSSRPPVNVAVTRIGTGSKTLTPGEVGAAVSWSDVFNEDSIVNVSTQYNYQINTKLQETVVQIWINADSDPTASTNINLIDGTPGTGTSTPYYIASNGALKYALVTGSSTSRDGGTLDENDYRLTLKLMSAATRSRLSQLIFVIDPDTHSASLDIAAIKTEDVKRTNATIASGVLTNIYGIDVVQTGFMALANSSGKIPAAGGTLGRILCAYVPYWAMGWKRHTTIETDRDILTGDNILVAKMRVGFIARGADAATVTYNLTV